MVEKAKNRTFLFEEIKELMKKALNLHHVDWQSVKEETLLGPGGLNLDSVDILELVVHFEQKYQYKVSDPELGKKYFQSMGTLLDFVESAQLQQQKK